jgi:hypothetical protein
MLEKLVAVAMMAAVVGSAFYFFGDVDTGPRAVIALAPVTADMEDAE